MSLTELELETSPENAEGLEDRLFALGAQSVELFDAGDEPLFEPPPGTHPLWSSVRLRALFRDPLQAEIARAALQAQDSTPGAAPVGTQLSALDDRDWVRAGLAGLTRIHSGGPLWIVPSWETPPDVPNGVYVHLDPGLAFGTGSHPTTAMCLAALAAVPPAGQTVLDYGCGSGILAIASLKLGATSALGVDIDPQALQATRLNAARNGIDEPRLPTATPDRDPPAAAFDLVLANILAGPLIELAPTLARAARPGARLLLAGLLDRQAEPVMAAYRDAFDIAIGDRRDDWVLLVGQRR
ncbi:Ribosomal protein L11 methyltransferase [Thioalkalivibrio nitratireducens DSM 14787]|uniref:Ribosomal protein L11 methyltransferase n=1 Tax=Thioalkalivibrio nitratireducens (strain DSM 14787 / UNIQEM 213 / ALEN2) TaxID=1255043 RepID=L0DRF7_THIND|nr:50S ribosomal protein L11 methyltransferase [Thioalkalivibrio nitratireducens]AGA32174.1 Ribosomal protein L11 methyltransferase [Thioalkalivibrio nitratireducens DSM 14787]